MKNSQEIENEQKKLVLVICYENEILKPVQWIQKLNNACLTTLFLDLPASS